MKSIALTNEKIRIDFSGSGGLRGFTDLTTGRNYIESTGAEEIPLFRLACTEFEDGHVLPGEIRFSSRLAGDIACTEEDHGLRFIFSSIDGMDMTAVCTVFLDGDTGLSRWRIQITNYTKYAIKIVEYPVIESVMQLGDSMEDDRILLPKQDGFLLPNPTFMNWEGDRPDRYFDQRFDYPGEGRGLPDGLCAQLLAYYDGESGMYIGVHDGEGHAKRLGPVWKRRDGIPDTIDLSPVHRIPEFPGNDFFCSYDTVLGCFHGDWQTAAGIYKAWAKSQSWCRKKLWERGDIPDWIKEGAFFFNFRLRYQQGGETFLDTADQYVKAWANILDMPIVAMMCGWEKWGEWTGPDYFPPYGGDNRFRRMCARMKDAGIRPFPFGLSGFKLPVRKKLGKDWPPA